MFRSESGVQQSTVPLILYVGEDTISSPREQLRRGVSEKTVQAPPSPPRDLSIFQRPWSMASFGSVCGGFQSHRVSCEGARPGTAE